MPKDVDQPSAAMILDINKEVYSKILLLSGAENSDAVVILKVNSPSIIMAGIIIRVATPSGWLVPV